jgi:uncharacterized protein (DUF2147 family)
MMEAIMKAIFSQLLYFGLLLIAVNAFADNSAVLGKWKTIDDETGQAKSMVEIYQQDGKLYGKIVELFRDPNEDPDPVCSKCEGERQDQKVIGMVIIEGLEKQDDTWTNGTILDPQNGKTYRCKIWLEEDKLKVRGYWGIVFRTQTWYRPE